MESLADDEALARDILGQFLDDTPHQVRDLRDSLAAGDAAGVRLRAHTIKGAASSVGGFGLATLASEIEQAAVAGNLAAVSSLAPGLEVALEALRRAIRDERLDTAA